MMRVARFVTLVVLVAGAVNVLLACAGGRHEPEPVRVGLVVDSTGIDDKGLNAATWSGVQSGTDAVGGLYSFAIAESEIDFATTVQSLIDIGFDVIVSIGELTQDLVYEAARNNVDAFFIGVGHQQSGAENVAGLVFPEGYEGFLAGALAAHVSDNDSVVAVLGPGTTSVIELGVGFESGARHVKPNIKVATFAHSPMGSVGFDSAGWGADIVRNAVQSGADVIFGGGTDAGEAALLAASKHDTIRCIGSRVDQWVARPEARPCLVSSVVWLIHEGVHKLIVDSQTAAPNFGRVTGDLSVAPFHGIDTVVAAQIGVAMEEILAGLSDGSIQVNPRDPT